MQKHVNFFLTSYFYIKQTLKDIMPM